MVIGPRIWKTGIAVTACIFLIQVLNLGSPLLAVVAAIITIQPSITKSLSRGANRVLATLMGGIVGFVAYYFLGAHPIIVGFAVIIAIAFAIKFKLQDGIIITAITVPAVMMDVTGNAVIFTAYRLLETLIGIGVGVTINLVFSPPNTERYLMDNLLGVNQKLKTLYVAVINGFITNTGYDGVKLEEMIAGIRDEFEEIRRKKFEFKDEISYRKVSKNYQVKKYDCLITGLILIFERILGIYYIELNRYGRNLQSEETSVEYKEILGTVQKLVTITVSMQENLLDYLGNNDPDLAIYLQNCGEQANWLSTDLRKQINTWHLLEENKAKAMSLMELSSAAYEMEQIIQQLKRIACQLKDMNPPEATNQDMAN